MKLLYDLKEIMEKIYSLNVPLKVSVAKVILGKT